MSEITRVSAAEFQRAFGQLSDKAMQQPVAITKHGREIDAVLASNEFFTLAGTNL